MTVLVDLPYEVLATLFAELAHQVSRTLPGPEGLLTRPSDELQTRSFFEYRETSVATQLCLQYTSQTRCRL